MSIRDHFRTLTRTSLVRSIVVLVGGTAFAHGITAAALPIITRLYTPADFSALAVFAGVLSIASISACLRFDLAIPIPNEDDEALDLLVLALSCAGVVAAALAALILALPDAAFDAFNQPTLVPWLWLLPIGVLLSGGYNALQMWFVRKKEFGSIARSRVTQSTAAASTQVSMGLMGWAPLGLILGQMLNTGAGCIALGYRLLKDNRRTLRLVTLKRMRRAFAAHDRFPKYSTLEAICNSASIQLPIIVIAALVAGQEAGYLVLAMTAMQVPMGLIGTAVSQVYLSRAPDEHRARRLDTFTTSIYAGLLKSGVGPLAFAGLIAPILFPVIFGPQWHRAGVLVAWMTPWFIMQFLSVPVSMALHVTGHQRAAFALQVLGLVMRIGPVYLASAFAAGWVSETYALSGCAFYLVYLVVVLRMVNAKRDEVVAQTWLAMPIVLAWMAAGAAISFTSFKLGWLAS